MRHRGFPPTNDASRKRSNTASANWTRVAERLKCPACGRKNALGQEDSPERGLHIRRCRYCGKDRVIDIREYLGDDAP